MQKFVIVPEQCFIHIRPYRS